MLNNIVLVDMNNDLAKAWTKERRDIEGIEIKIMANTNILNVERKQNMAYVSPANSFLFMDGGIDYVYSRMMFPKVESRLKSALMKRKQKTSLGRDFLPIGNAIIVDADTDSKIYMIAAPTMFFPQNVDKTHNAYHSTYAALKLAIDCCKVSEIVFCGMGAGIGGISPSDCAKQMWDAIYDVVNGHDPLIEKEIDIVKEQPNMYANKELFDTYRVSVSKNFTIV